MLCTMFASLRKGELPETVVTDAVCDECKLEI